MTPMASPAAAPDAPQGTSPHGAVAATAKHKFNPVDNRSSLYGKCMHLLVDYFLSG
nr:hypothetical protein [uncultured organism]